MLTRAEELGLIRSAAAGDRDAAERLVREHQRGAYMYILRMCNRPEVAEDTVQEAFVRALTNLERFDPRFRFSTWLYTIARRVYLNTAQKRSAASNCDGLGEGVGERGDQRRGGADAKRAAAGGAEVVAESEAKRRTRVRLEEALETLPPAQREMLVLFHQCGWPVWLIAQQLEVPQGTVKSHLHRARRRLRDALERAGVAGARRPASAGPPPEARGAEVSEVRPGEVRLGEVRLGEVRLGEAGDGDEERGDVGTRA